MPAVPSTQSAESVYLTASQVKRRYGGRSDMWLWRLLKNDEGFPRPLVLCGQRLWSLSELEAYEGSKRSAA
jgi:predicted DNA-binding transcriptional regulator AlpA